ncbi:MAG: hypothetical protein KJ995_03065 [Candidatus Omnitrophica bacterium]|nr:hypothetical protein [Candidatus Omnitrophota bacterium]MBU1784406.1 hypothetical protein [Candidatus Omnitrophota bacterium]MBU1851367.1 hypothetical protein [Candidatus Omnitrophota bacterium]
MMCKCVGCGKAGCIAMLAVCCLLFAGTRAEAKREKSDSGSKKIKYVKVPGGLKTIMELDRSNRAMLDGVKGETVNFDRVRKAVEYGNLNIGASSDKVIEEVGHPVITVYDEQTDTVQWVYKPGTSSFFEKYKIYLIFDLDGILIGWKVPERWDEERTPKPETKLTVIESAT